jgi:hypothetical protein
MKKSTFQAANLDKLLYARHVRMEVGHFPDSSVSCCLHSIKQLCLFSSKLPGQMVEGDIYSYLLHLKTTKHRIQAVENDRVKLSAVGYRTSKTVTLNLGAAELLHRFLCIFCLPGL